MPREDRQTLAEAADTLGVHYMTAYRYVRTGLLPAEKVGRRWFVDPDALEAVAASEGASPAGRGRRGYPARMRRCLLAGDEAGAWRLVAEALTSGLEPDQVLLEVITPALSSVGDGWREGTVRIVDEHQATAVVSRLVARLGPRFAVRGTTAGRVIVGAAPGDHHGLPSAILRDLLRGRNFDAVDLGADVPPTSWADAVHEAADREVRLIAVGMGAMTAEMRPAVTDAIVAIRATGVLGATVPIIIGGPGVPTSADAIAMGATAHTASTAAAVELIAELAERGQAGS